MTASYEYKNAFLYFIIRPDINSETDALLYCSGVDLLRFLPITKGRHRPMSNPAMRGLQLVNLGVRALALSNGATPKTLKGDVCTEAIPMKDGLYKEGLLIENASESLPEELVNYGVINILKKIANGCLIYDTLPDILLKPDELQAFIEDMCKKYGG
jgi:hypothetical protein